MNPFGNLENHFELRTSVPATWDLAL